MALFSFYSMRKPRQFGHKPIYFDPRKEALEKRIHKVKMEMGVEDVDYEQYKEAIRGSFVDATSHLKKSRDKGDDVRNRIYKNMRLFIILIILGLGLWYFYFR